MFQVPPSERCPSSCAQDSKVEAVAEGEDKLVDWLDWLDWPAIACFCLALLQEHTR